MSDYVTDTKSVLDQALRVLQAMVDVAADGGWLFTALGAMHLAQMVTQGRWHADEGLGDLPGLDEPAVRMLHTKGVKGLRQLASTKPDTLKNWLRGVGFKERQLAELHGQQMAFFLALLDAKLGFDTASSASVQRQADKERPLNNQVMPALVTRDRSSSASGARYPSGFEPGYPHSPQTPPSTGYSA